MNMTRNTDTTVEVIMKKAALVKRSYEPSMSASFIARQVGVLASLLFQWRKLSAKAR